jgi:hypothetical protein
MVAALIMGGAIRPPPVGVNIFGKMIGMPAGGIRMKVPASYA